LSIEPGSALKSMYIKGNYTPLSDNLCNIQYSMLQQHLVSNGYEQYEISSFAKTPFEQNKSKHNSSYWTKEAYLGLGPAAHSFDGDVRYWNNSSVVKYCKYYLGKGGSWEEACGKEILSAEDKFNESVMLGLRTVNGVCISGLDERCYGKISDMVSALVENGDLVKEGDKIRIPSNKLFVSDGIISKLFIV
jgi:Coproporphyrinogen III oxidase and related Fe-S oxidoreductases